MRSCSAGAYPFGSTRDDCAVGLPTCLDLAEVMAAKAPEVPQVVLIKGLEALSDQQFAQVLKGMQHMVRILGVEHNTARPMHAE